ncbi:MAG: hypothetical protein KAX53_06890 [Saprospiraceae bacterium]|nr:hypothetical protein [Saprospiraceae bacterium]
MDTLIVHAKEENIATIIAFLKSKKVAYEFKKSRKKNEKAYNPEFVKKILDTKNEESIIIDPEKPWQSLGL